MKKINIPLENQVVDLETAKKLTKKLASVGVEMESAFYYQRRRNRILNDEIKYSDKSVYTKWQKWWLLEAKRCDSGNAYKQVESIPALTLPELLAVLPRHLQSKTATDIERLSSSCESLYSRAVLPYYISYSNSNLGVLKSIPYQNPDTNDNPATAAAKLAIWCIDNGHMGVER